jgi:hypothetical protein
MLKEIPKIEDAGDEDVSRMYFLTTFFSEI